MHNAPIVCILTLKLLCFSFRNVLVIFALLPSQIQSVASLIVENSSESQYAAVQKLRVLLASA